MDSAPDTAVSLCATWVAMDPAKVQPQRLTCMQEFGAAMLRIQPLLAFSRVSMTASSTTYISKISTVVNLMMSSPFTDNRLCLLKVFLFAVGLHLVSSTSCFYRLLSLQLSKKAIVVAWKKPPKCFLFIILHCLGTRFMKHYGTDTNHFILQNFSLLHHIPCIFF